MVQAITRNEAQARRLAGDLAAQWRATVGWLRELSAEDLARPAIVPGHTVRDVVGHLLFLATELQDSLARPTTVRPVTLAAHLRSRAHATTRLEELAVQAVGDETGLVVVRQLAAVVTDLERELADELPLAVETRFDPLRTTDLLRSKLLVLVQQSDDLSASLPERGAVPLQRAALVDAVRVLAEVLADTHPGRSVEVRVPPAVAVQLASPEGGGPTHTRGTPPTVVEMAPIVFLRLGSGRLGWSDSVARHLVNASGTHANLSPWFPVARP